MFRKIRLVEKLAAGGLVVGGTGWFAKDGLAERAPMMMEQLDIYRHKVSGMSRFFRTFAVAMEIAADYKMNDYRVGDPEDLKILCHQRNAVRLRTLCEKNGGLYIKFGQHLAQLDYILPPEYCQTLSSLLAACPPMSYESVQKVLAQELHRPLSDMFEHFERKPIATASLAQVHVATLKHSGEKVAVKVQHEGLRTASRGDILTVKMLIDLAHKLFPNFDYRWLAEETAENLPKELDFEMEGKNCERCRKNLGPGDDVTTPTIYWKLTTPCVLTMSFESGCHIFDVMNIESMGLKPADVSRLVSKVFADQIFVHGFLHCDPHGGNILVRPHPRLKHMPQLVILDHGLYRELSPDFRLDYAHLWHGLVMGNEDEIRKAATALGADDDTYRLFAAMLTLRSWNHIITEDNDRSIDRLGRVSSPEEQEELRGYAEVYFREISELLSKMPRQLLLVLKTNDNLRSVDQALGAQLNSLSITAETVAKVIEQEEIVKGNGSWRERVTAKLHTAGMLFRVFLFRSIVACNEMAQHLRSLFTSS